jgi:K(+)-stimulated pyrophosphate-energized sodium pump
MIEEVRRQFREIPGPAEGKAGVKPDSPLRRDLDRRPRSSEMIVPGLLAVLVPLVVGFIGVEPRRPARRRTRHRRLMALFMANAGGAWDNAKKYIEAARTAARAASRTRPPSSATPWATRSRTPPARR